MAVFISDKSTGYQFLRNKINKTHTKETFYKKYVGENFTVY